MMNGSAILLQCSAISNYEDHDTHRRYIWDSQNSLDAYTFDGIVKIIWITEVLILLPAKTAS